VFIVACATATALPAALSSPKIPFKFSKLWLAISKSANACSCFILLIALAFCCSKAVTSAPLFLASLNSSAYCCSTSNNSRSRSLTPSNASSFLTSCNSRCNETWLVSCSD